MSRESTTRACLTLRSRQLRALQDLSRETGAPVAELTRRAVDAFLAGRVAGFVPGVAAIPRRAVRARTGPLDDPLVNAPARRPCDSRLVLARLDLAPLDRIRQAAQGSARNARGLDDHRIKLQQTHGGARCRRPGEPLRRFLAPGTRAPDLPLRSRKAKGRAPDSRRRSGPR